jgi:hypothetical protein
MGRLISTLLLTLAALGVSGCGRSNPPAMAPENPVLSNDRPATPPDLSEVSLRHPRRP